MRQDDIDGMTEIADRMTLALQEIRDQIKIMDGVVDASPVRDKGQPMNFGQLIALANSAAETRRVISGGLVSQLWRIERMIRQNMIASTEQEGS